VAAHTAVLGFDFLKKEADTAQLDLDSLVPVHHLHDMYLEDAQQINNTYSGWMDECVEAVTTIAETLHEKRRAEEEEEEEEEEEDEEILEARVHGSSRTRERCAAKI
jgi:hypothetical protein